MTLFFYIIFNIFLSLGSTSSRRTIRGSGNIYCRDCDTMSYIGLGWYHCRTENELTHIEFICPDGLTSIFITTHNAIKLKVTMILSSIYDKIVYKVQVGQMQAGEIDFVCTKGTSKIYVQASYLIASEETREREFGALKKIKDNYPKYVISMTPLVTRTDDDGIIHLSLREFLVRGF